MKHVMKLLLLFLLFVMVSPVGAQTALPYAALNAALTDRVAVPAYRRLDKAMAELEQSTAGFCTAPSPATLSGAENAFHAAMGAWQHAQPIGFGPVTENARAARIEFWPDSGGSTARQIRRALTQRDPALLTPGGLEGKSVALQNLATFERILAEHAPRVATGAAQAGDEYACALMAAIARFQARTAKAILREWAAPGGFAETIKGAAPGNARYPNPRIAATDYIKGLANTFDAIIQQKLERPMGKTFADARPRRAESWRTARSIDNILANLETARALFATPGGFADLTTAAGAGPMADGMTEFFDKAIAMARGIGMPLKDAVESAEARPRLDTLLEMMKTLRTLIAGPMAQEVGLVVGFNALDGD